MNNYGIMTKTQHGAVCNRTARGLDDVLNRAHGAIDTAHGQVNVLLSLKGDMPRLESHLVQIGQMLVKLNQIKLNLQEKQLEKDKVNEWNTKDTLQ
jgi:hypothetical protein